MKKLSWSFALALVLGHVRIAQAQLGTPESGTTNLPDLSFGGGIAGVVETITLLLLALAGILSVLFLIYGGMQYIFAGANEDLAKSGKSTIRNAVIGLIIVILSYTVVSVIFNTLVDDSGIVTP
jgi:hypothetical protein